VSMRRRLRQLENGCCQWPECSIDPNASPIYEVVWDDEGESGVPEGSSPPCPRCGRRKLTVVNWDDAKPLPIGSGAKVEEGSSLSDYPPWAGTWGEGKS
jgi:hypothetical protein